MKCSLIATLLVLFAVSSPATARPPATQPSVPQPRLTIEYSGPVRTNPYAQMETRSTDPGARAATWRYYYSPPTCFYFGYPYSGWYGGYSRYGSHFGRPFGICLEFNGSY